jgi:hypothetical protein
VSSTFTQPIVQPVGPHPVKWWQKPVVAIATVVVVTGLTGGIAYAATRGDSAAGTTNEMQFGGGGQFPGGQQGQNGQQGQQGQQGQRGQFPGGGQPPNQGTQGQNTGGTGTPQGQPGTAPTT